MAEAINGETSTVLKGKSAKPVIQIPQFQVEAIEISYHHYTPYWYAGYDDYSQNGVVLTVATIAALIVANTGLGVSAATTVASAIYTALGSNIYSDIYFRTYRYYATLEYGPGLPTIWYNKFVTYTYSDAARTHILTGPTTEIYESIGPM
ncbi:MAG: hypothetical protein EOL98_10720 [Negativicutes bacterium]|nr:hypothetical protein [Negativicutes bacterium]